MSSHRPVPVLVQALATVAMLLLASCGSGQSASGEGEAQHIAAANRSVGQILVDAEGRSLYVSTEDIQGQASVCDRDCLSHWPAVEGTVGAGDGVDAGLIGTIVRDDGTKQATYAGWPLYRNAGDGKPGELNGQGAEDAWYVVSPEGDIITRSAAGAGAGGY